MLQHLEQGDIKVLNTLSGALHQTFIYAVHLRQEAGPLHAELLQLHSRGVPNIMFWFCLISQLLSAAILDQLASFLYTLNTATTFQTSTWQNLDRKLYLDAGKLACFRCKTEIIC